MQVIYTSALQLRLLSALVLGVLAIPFPALAEESLSTIEKRTVTGLVQNQDLRRVPQAIVELRDQEGTLIESGITDEDGEFSIVSPKDGILSARAILETYRSEYIVLDLGKEQPVPITLTLSVTQEIALEIVAPLVPIQLKASSETYSVSRKDIEVLPRGNNNDVSQVLLTIPSAVNGALKQIHIRQDHSNLQFRIDGVPIPETVSAVFSDVITPRTWERADIILGGMEAQYGNRTAAIIDITSKKGTDPGFGSLQGFGGSNETVTPSFEYGGTLGDRFRFYMLNSFTTTNRGIEPPTPGKSVFHDQSNSNQTYLRGDFQLNNQNNFTWLFLNSVSKFQIPTTPGQMVDPTTLGLIQAQMPGFTPVRSQDIDENQKENNQYAHMVWRHDMNNNANLMTAGYFRHTRATFTTDPFNALSYVQDTDEPFSAGSQDRWAYSAGIRMVYVNRLNNHHLLNTGLQIERNEAINKTRLFAFARDGAGNPTGPVIVLPADSREIGWREEFWIQDQWTPDDRWTFNVGIRYDHIQALTNDGQVSPRIGVTYRYNSATAIHAYYGRLFTPPSLENVRFLQLNTIGTTAQPENLTVTTPEPERAHYFEVGVYRALGQLATLELTGWYKLSENLADAGQFGTTPLLNFFAFNNGWQRGVDFSVKANFSRDFAGRANVAWGQCKGQGLQSGFFLLEQVEIDDINTSSGIFCDHMQEVTSSAVLAYRLFAGTTISGQMLYGSGLRTTSPGGKTNDTHEPSYTIYNASLTHIFPFPNQYKLLLGFDIVNMFDQTVLLNSGEGSIGLGVAHFGMPRSFFFRAQLFFTS